MESDQTEGTTHCSFDTVKPQSELNPTTTVVDSVITASPITKLPHLDPIHTQDVGTTRSIHYEDHEQQIPEDPPPPVSIVEVQAAPNPTTPSFSAPLPVVSIVEVPSFSRPRKQSTNSLGSSLAKGTTLLCFRMSDVAVSLCILLPLTIAMWRGIWNVMAYYTEPWISIIVGNGMLLVQYGFQETIKQWVPLPPKMNFILFYTISRTLLFAHAFAQINLWRGIWELLDAKTGVGSELSILSMLIGMTGLIGLKTLCNVLATPLFVGVDEATSIHDCQLAFKTPITSKWKYFFDVLWSIIVIQNLVALAWRGCWNLTVLLIYPGEPILAASMSLALGAAITIILSILQPCYFRFMIKLHGIMRVAVFDLVTTWAFLACVLAWRGNWELYDLVTIFDPATEQIYNEWFLTIVGTVGCIILGCLSTVAARGITIDGEDSGDGSTEWPISYISLLQKKRHHGIPFPEPWLIRYLFTSQRMLMTEPLTQRRRSSALGPTSANFSIPPPSKMLDEEKQHPLNLYSNNSIYVDHFDVEPRSKLQLPDNSNKNC